MDKLRGKPIIEPDYAILWLDENKELRVTMKAEVLFNMVKELKNG